MLQQHLPAILGCFLLALMVRLSVDFTGANEGNVTSRVMKKWVYISHVRAHTHDVRALTIAVPISHKDTIVERDLKIPRSRSKHLDSSYHKWAHLGVPMLISGGDDTKLFAYSAREFTKFSPHDICPVPQRPHIQYAVNTIFNQAALLLIQASYWIDVLLVRALSGGAAKTDLVARVKCKAPRKITCSAISPSGALFAFSDHVKCCLFELKRIASSKSPWVVNKCHLPLDLPFAHSMVFSADSSRLMIAGCDRRVYEKDPREMNKHERNQMAQRKKEEGNLLFKNGKYQRAMKKYEKATDCINEDEPFEDDDQKIVKSLRVSCWLNGAATCLKRNYFQEAIKQCSKVLEVESCNVKALYRRAQAFMETADLHLAELDIKKALEIDPQNREVKLIQKNLKQLQAESNKRDAKLSTTMFARLSNENSSAAKRLKVEETESKNEENVGEINMR